jgi:hypothetical protein
LASVACSGNVTSSDASSRVRGATFTLHAVDGALLPARFAPMEASPAGTVVRIEAGQLTFGLDGRASGQWRGTGELASISSIFLGTYVEDGARVLISAGADAPDTAVVFDDIMTVRAQFFREPSRERYVVAMTYVRDPAMR